jgi:RNA polymerase sigma-70 factor (ECF subfamily)
MGTGILRPLATAAPAPRVGPVPECLSIQQVYEAHFRYVWRCLRALGVNQDALEDAAHDVFLVVQRKLPSFDGEHAQLTTWLYEIALRVARRYRTKSAREAQRRADVPASPDPAWGADGEGETGPISLRLVNTDDSQGALEQAERLALARAALGALDAEKREAFVLSCVEQLSAPEIARITGVPLNTVYSRIRAARRAFEVQIARRAAAPARRSR